MKKLLFVLFLMISSVSFASDRVSWDSVYASDGTTTDIAIAGEVTVYTKSFDLASDSIFAAWYKSTSDGTVNLKIEVEQSYKKPTTEGSSDSDWCVIEDTGTLESALADENAHFDRVYFKPGTLARFKITGQTGNDASTTIDIKLFSQY